jgi:hypothetical protein
MGTRSMIGRKDEQGKTTGRYVHWDGYPSGVGQTLHNALRTYFGGDVDTMARYFIDEHPAGWSSIVGADFSLSSGFRNMDEKPSPYIRTDAGEPISNPDYVNQPECYCHGSREEPEQLLVCSCSDGDNSGCDPLYIEYVYGLAEEGLFISYHAPVPGEVDPPYDGTNYQPPKYTHVPYGVIPWDVDVDWGQIESDIAASLEAIHERSRA